SLVSVPGAQAKGQAGAATSFITKDFRRSPECDFGSYLRAILSLRRGRMAKRMLIMLAVVLVIIGGLGFFKFHQIQSAVQAASNFQMPPVAVTTIVAKREQWPAGMNAIGTVEAVQGVTVSADLPGIVAKIDFESGKYVNKGDVLVEL